jgi:6-phosphogluconolactonase/glucosamine-6-phosphate isomerase/deaminase
VGNDERCYDQSAMPCQQRQVLEERRNAANEEFSDLVMQLSSGSMAGRLYDSLTTKKDQAWEKVRAAERALNDHKEEHGC